MTTTRGTKNFLVYFAALLVTGIFSFLGFKGPSWARAAVGGKHQETASPSSLETLPSVARAISAAGPNLVEPKKKARSTAAKIRGTGAKKTAVRANGKKVASHRTARERTETVRSSL